MSVDEEQVGPHLEAVHGVADSRELAVCEIRRDVRKFDASPHRRDLDGFEGGPVHRDRGDVHDVPSIRRVHSRDSPERRAGPRGFVLDDFGGEPLLLLPQAFEESDPWQTVDDVAPLDSVPDDADPLA